MFLCCPADSDEQEADHRQNNGIYNEKAEGEDSINDLFDEKNQGDDTQDGVQHTDPEKIIDGTEMTDPFLCWRIIYPYIDR